MNSWACCLDKGKSSDRKDLSLISPILVKFGTVDVREAFKNNLLTTQGVVISHKAPPPCELHVQLQD